MKLRQDLDNPIRSYPSLPFSGNGRAANGNIITEYLAEILLGILSTMVAGITDTDDRRLSQVVRL